MSNDTKKLLFICGFFFLPLLILGVVLLITKHNLSLLLALLITGGVFSIIWFLSWLSDRLFPED